MRHASDSVAVRNEYLLERIKEIKADHPFWGYRRVLQEYYFMYKRCLTILDRAKSLFVSYVANLYTPLLLLYSIIATIFNQEWVNETEREHRLLGITSVG
jgi:hypothetical protein